MRLSRKGLGAEESPTLAISARAKALAAQGRKIINFGVGEPDFNTPQYICDAACEAIGKGMTRYTPASGTLELKKAVCEGIKQELSVEYTPQQIVVSNGAKHSIFNAMMALLDPGDEIIILAPYWVSYPEMARMCDAVPVFVQGAESNGFRPTIEQIEAACTPRTKVLLLNNPNNPTGAVYPAEELEQIARLVVEKDIYVISDEIYNKLLYDGRKPVSITSFGQDLVDRTVLVNGVSKTYAMTGWRIGWAAAPVDCAKVMGNIQSQVTSNPNSIAQYATEVALHGTGEEVRAMAAEFEKRRNRIAELVNAVPGMSARLPEGAFYLFVNVSGLLGKSYDGVVIEDSMQMANLLLDKMGVALVPGVAFGMEGYLRLSYALSMEAIEQGVALLAEFAAGMK